MTLRNLTPAPCLSMIFSETATHRFGSCSGSPCFPPRRQACPICAFALNEAGQPCQGAASDQQCRLAGNGGARFGICSAPGPKEPDRKFTLRELTPSHKPHPQTASGYCNDQHLISA